MSDQHPKLQFLGVVYHHEDNVDCDLEQGVSDTGETKPEAEPEGVDGEWEQAGEDADQSKS